MAKKRVKRKAGKWRSWDANRSWHVADKYGNDIICECLTKADADRIARLLNADDARRAKAGWKETTNANRK